MEDQAKGSGLDTAGQTSASKVHFPSCSFLTFTNGFLPWKEAERVGLDMIQFIQLNLKSFIYWCLKMVRLGKHV